MKTRTRLATAFLALAATAVAAHAAERSAERGERAAFRFEQADADKSGDVTFEEFAAVMNDRLAKADADGDKRITVAEMADQIERARAENMARRIIARFDGNGDGVLTLEEIEAGQTTIFARLDRNADGKIVPDEMPKRGKPRP